MKRDTQHGEIFNRLFYSLVTRNSIAEQHSMTTVSSHSTITSAATPPTMKALRYIDGTLTLSTVPTPHPQQGEVLVHVSAAGVNPVDLKARVEGALYSTGVDGVGQICAVGEEVDTRWIGERVMWHGSLLQMRSGRAEAGSYNEYAAIDENALVGIPAEITDEIAATIPCPGGTAQQIVDGLGPVIEARGADTSAVFVQSASGSVGRITVQLLARRYPTLLIVGSASEAHHPDLRALGITPVPYRSATVHSESFEFEQVLSAVTARGRTLIGIANFMGGRNLQQHYEYLDENSVLVSVFGGQLPDQEAPRGPFVHVIALGKAYEVKADPSLAPSIPAYTATSHPVRAMRDAYQTVTDLVAAGAIQPPTPHIMKPDAICGLTIATLVGKPVMLLEMEAESR